MLDFKNNKLFVDEKIMNELSNETDNKIIQSNLSMSTLESNLKKLLIENYNDYAIRLIDVFVEHKKDTNKYKVCVRYAVNHYPFPSGITKILECEKTVIKDEEV